jgi:hypothetical protein
VAWAMPCVLKQGAFGLGFLRVLSGDSLVVLRGPLGLSPTPVKDHCHEILTTHGTCLL